MARALKHSAKVRKQRAARMQQWRAKHPDAWKAIQAKSYAKHREKRRAEQRARWHSQPHPSTPQSRLRHAANMQKWRKANRAKLSAYLKEWCRKNPEKRIANSRRYYERHGEQIRAKARAYGKKHGHRQHLKENYGLTPEAYAQMFEAQHGGCAICGRPPSKRRLAVDHDHATDIVRALLCGRCNVALGLLEDNPDICYKAAAYLIAWKDKHALNKAVQGEDL